MTVPPFHLAFPVTDLDRTRHFYLKALGCLEGRSAERWIDFNFYGHQLTAHLVDAEDAKPGSNEVDGHAVPVRHFGPILDWAEWQRLKTSLLAQGLDFQIEPHIRFAGQAAEQASFFILDPSRNCLEFKAFRNPQQVFARSAF